MLIAALRVRLQSYWRAWLFASAEDSLELICFWIHVSTFYSFSFFFLAVSIAVINFRCWNFTCLQPAYIFLLSARCLKCWFERWLSKVRFICLCESHKIPSDGSGRSNELFLLIRPKLFPVAQGRVTIPSLSQWWENSVGTHARNSDNEVGVQALLTAAAHRWENAVAFGNCAAVFEAVEVCVTS